MKALSAQIQCDDGITLLELLVSIAILSLLVVPISGSIDIGLRVWAKSHETAETQERVFLAKSRLDRWIESAYPFDSSRKTFQGETLLVGTAQSVEFTSSIHPDPQVDALYRVKLALNNGSLIMETMPDFGAKTGSRIWQTKELLSQVSKLSFSYMSGTDASGNPIWISQWGDSIEASYLPAAIKIIMEFENPDLVWPDQIVRLQTEERAFCRFLPAERQCQVGAFVE